MEDQNEYNNLEDKKNDPLCRKMYDYGKASNENSFLYKLRIMEYAGSETDFFNMSQEELKNAKQRGIIYNPDGKHTWGRNLSWLLGLINKKRDLVIFSNIIDKNIWRKDFVPESEEDMEDKQFSAFSREIAAAMKAGYAIEIKDASILLKCENPQADKLRIDQIDPSFEEIENSLVKVMNFIFNHVSEYFDNDINNFFMFCKKIKIDKNPLDSPITSEDYDFDSEEYKKYKEYDEERSFYNDLGYEFTDNKDNFLIMVKYFSKLIEYGFIYDEDYNNGKIFDVLEMKKEHEDVKQFNKRGN